ncbi:Ribonuclease H superfamily protein [Abortiporus biennis]
MKDKKGPLVVLEYPGGKGGGMTSKRYQEQVLDAVLKDFYTQMKETRGSILFQQDSAPSHTSKSTKQWFRDHGIPLLYYPPSSPDMNPIERVWHELKRLLQLLPHPPTTVRGLQDAVRDAWDSLPIEDINKHVNHMQNRVEDVLAAKEGHIRY